MIGSGDNQLLSTAATEPSDMDTEPSNWVLLSSSEGGDEPSMGEFNMQV